MNFDLVSLLMGLGTGVLIMLVLFTWSRGGIHRAEAQALRGELAAVQASAAQKQAEANTQMSHLQGQVAEANGRISTLHSQLEEATGQIGSLQQALAESQAQQAAPAPEAPAAPAELVAEPAPAADASADAPPAAAVAELPTTTGQPQDLKIINGIGGNYEKRLNKAGILNFAQLAAQTAAQLHDIIKPQGWQTLDFGTWIEEARLFATNPALLTGRIVELPNLNAIEAQQLFAAGIRSLADLAAQSEEHLRELITPTDPAKFNPAEWVADAKRLLG